MDLHDDRGTWKGEPEPFDWQTVLGVLLGIALLLMPVCEHL